MPFARIPLIVLTLVLSAARMTIAQDASSAAGWVVIPVDEYRSLRARAYPPEHPPDPPPVDAALTRLEYELSLDGGAATGSATLVVDVLKEGWVEVVIPPGLLVRDARLDGRPVSLVDKPQPHVLLSTRGRSVLTLEVVLPIVTTGEAESLTIPGAPAALTRASLRVPRAGIDLRVSNGFLAATEEGDGFSRWTAHGRAHEPLTFAWRRRVDDRRADQPLRFRGSVTQLVGLGEEVIQVAATVRLDVTSGMAQAVLVRLPAGLSVNDVSGALVADWEPQGTDALRVTFVEPVARNASFTLAGELRGPRDGTVAVPLLRLPESERETGGVAVEVLGSGEMLGPRAQALDPADASELGEIVAGRASPSMLAFRYRPIAGGAPRVLTVQVTRYDTQAVLLANVEEARYRALVAEDGKVLVQARYAVRNNRRSLLTIRLPEGATLWSASVAGRSVRPGRSTSDALLVPLEKERTGDDAPPFLVEVVYVARVTPWDAKGDARLALPAIDLPISRTGVVLHHSPRFRVKPAPGEFRTEPYLDPFTEVLRVADVRSARGITVPAPAPEPVREDQAAASLQQLADQFSKDAGRRIAGVLPVDVPFPRFGPAIFLASELTPETHVATLGLEYQRQRGE